MRQDHDQYGETARPVEERAPLDGTGLQSRANVTWNLISCLSDCQTEQYSFARQRDGSIDNVISGIAVDDEVQLARERVDGDRLPHERR